MNNRLVRCPSCRASFLADDDESARPISCPKCGAVVTQPPALPVSVPVEPEANRSVFVAAKGSHPRRRIVERVLLGLTLVGLIAVVGDLAWPWLRSQWTPQGPGDRVEAVADRYLRAITEGDRETVARLGTVDLPPAIRSFRAVRRNPGGNMVVKGSFAEIAHLHARIDEKFLFDPASGRYTPRDALGPAAEVLDTLHDAKAKAEQSGIYKKMQSGDPNDIFDAAEGFGKVFTDLAEGVLAPKKLVPTYKQLVEEADPPLSPSERALAMDYANYQTTWDAMLGRRFPTIKADGPFVFELAEVTASVNDALGSSGDPPTTLRLGLARFRLEGIDTGWRITSARRQGAEPSGSKADRRD